MDKIFIKNLRIRTTIGVLPHERKYPQLIVISLEIFFSGEAKNSDQISDALDYDAICSQTVELVKKTSFRLIERLAEEVAQSIIKKFGAEKVNVLLIKPNALKHTSEVGIQISRGKHDSK
ncbi:MAG: dihydroneopterin aldolase [Pseudomonadota bacterium]|nr:dihydroneopterin aldolase [Pseudomonadota bacterium]